MEIDDGSEEREEDKEIVCCRFTVILYFGTFHVNMKSVLQAMEAQHCELCRYFCRIDIALQIEVNRREKRRERLKGAAQQVEIQR